MSKVLLLTGGPVYAHDFAESSAALSDVWRAGGYDVYVLDHPDAVVEALGHGYDALAVNALRWRMLLDRYDAWRDEWGYCTPDRTRELEVQRINCHHNFTQIERHFGEDVWVTRKGAIQAKRGMWAMIPGSMGTRSYIVTGLENDMAFHSAPHGAGRRYSRTKARKLFTMTDLDQAMNGIEFRRSSVLLDEIPSAYKDIDEVIENAKSLVEVKHTLRQFINIKGD